MQFEQCKSDLGIIFNNWIVSEYQNTFVCRMNAKVLNSIWPLGKGTHTISV